MPELYHGTLLRNLPQIEKQGLVPQVGSFTEKVYGKNARGVVPAVFMADEEGLERVVHAMVAAITDEVTEKDVEEYRLHPDVQMNDDLFFKYGAILVVEQSDGFGRTGGKVIGAEEPLQAEEGDWYSVEVVSPIRVMSGKDLRDFLDERGLLPSEINDFVESWAKPSLN